jgi:hypothetical protein
MIRQIISLSSEMIEEERTPWYLATEVPVRRIELRFGKMGVNDFFDINDIGTDSHAQFMNWTVDNSGAFDYAADTRGYTVGLLAEYHEHNWTFRFEEALMPLVANGIDLIAICGGRADARTHRVLLQRPPVAGCYGVDLQHINDPVQPRPRFQPRVHLEF